MNTFIINLASRPERMERLAFQLNALGLPYERIEAVNGLDDTDIGRPKGHPLSNPEYACFLSHLKALTVLVNTGADHGLILEDDIVLSKNVSTALEMSVHHLAENVIVRLEAPTNSHWRRPSFVYRRPISKQKDFALYTLKNRSLGSGAYMVSRAAARHLLADLTTPDYPIDKRLFGMSKPIHAPLKVLQFDPSLAIQRQFLEEGINEKSDIEPDFRARVSPPRLKKTALTAPFFNIYYNLGDIGRFACLKLGLSRRFPFDG